MARKKIKKAFRKKKDSGEIGKSLFIKLENDERKLLEKNMLEMREKLILCLDSMRNVTDYAKDKKTTLSNVKASAKEIKKNFELLNSCIPQEIEEKEAKKEREAKREIRKETKVARVKEEKAEAIEKHEEVEVMGEVVGEAGEVEKKGEEEKKKIVDKRTMLQKELESIREKLKKFV